MLVAAIASIFGLAVLFFLCGIFCYAFCGFLCKEREEDIIKPTSAGWEAKNYYDPTPTVVSSPENIFQPSIYSFKIKKGGNQNNTDHYAVINPAVLHNSTREGREDRHIIPSTFNYSSHIQRDRSRVSPISNSDQCPLVKSEMTEMSRMMSNGNGHFGKKGKIWST